MLEFIIKDKDIRFPCSLLVTTSMYYFILLFLGGEMSRILFISLPLKGYMS